MQVKTHSKPDWGLASCADSLELAIQTEQILACANGEEVQPATLYLRNFKILKFEIESCCRETTSCVQGSNLLVELGIETKNLDPPLLWVPWTLFDGVNIDSTRELLRTTK